MEHETVRLVVETGCEELRPFVDGIGQSLNEIASSASNVAHIAMFLYVLTLVATTAAFGIMLVTKFGWRDKLIMKAPKLISELFSCDFCLSWWTCLLLSVMAAFLVGEWFTVGVAVFATPLTRRLIL